MPQLRITPPPYRRPHLGALIFRCALWAFAIWIGWEVGTALSAAAEATRNNLRGHANVIETRVS